MKKTNQQKEINKIKCVDNQNSKVKNAGKVIGGVCGVVVLAGMAVTAFAAGHKEASAGTEAARNHGTSVVSEAGSFRGRGARATRAVSGVSEIGKAREFMAVDSAIAEDESSETAKESVAVGEDAVNEISTTGEYSEFGDAYWLKQMSVSGLNVTDVAASSGYDSALEDVKGDDIRKKAIKKSFQDVNETYLKLKEEMEKKEAEWKELLGNVKDWSNAKFSKEIDTLAESMKNICDQLSSLQDICYYNLDALKYGADNYDADYKKWDTVFQEVASIQRKYYLQLDHIYQKISDETMKVYEKYGLKQDEKDQEYYFNGKKVRYFEDGIWEKQSFSGSMSSGNSGEVDVFATRDKNGDLTGFEEYGIENTKDRVKEHYNIKDEFFSGESGDSDQESAS